MLHKQSLFAFEVEEFKKSPILVGCEFMGYCFRLPLIQMHENEMR
jgi:hypothetical protein